MSLSFSRYYYLPGILAGTATVAAMVISLPPVGLAQSELNSRTVSPITVKIDGITENGSGVIVGKIGNYYLVLTAQHVVERDIDYDIYTTADQQKHQASGVYKFAKGGNDPDLALVAFESQNEYSIAPIGDSDKVQPGNKIYVLGFPAEDTDSEEQVEEDTTSEEQVKEIIPDFVPGHISLIGSRYTKGYTMKYTAITWGGMSGGPVFNAEGELVGIHGKPDIGRLAGQTVSTKKGFNRGIPINTYYRLAEAVDLFTVLQALKLPPDALAQSPEFQQLQAIIESEASHSDGAATLPSRPPVDPTVEETLIPVAVSPTSRQKIRLADLFPRLIVMRQDLETSVTLGSLETIEETVEETIEARAIVNQNPETYYGEGLSLYEQGNKQGAIDKYTQALKLNPNYVEAYFQRGNTLFELGNKQRAIEDYTQVVKLKADYAEAYFNRGVVYNAIENKQAAINDFQQAAKLYSEREDEDSYKEAIDLIDNLQG